MSLAAALPGLAAGSALATALGLSLLRPTRRLAPDTLALAWAAGLATAVPVAFAAALLGLPLTPWTIAALFAALGLAAYAVPRSWNPGDGAGDLAAPAAEPPWLLALSQAVLAAALAVALWKLAATPLWSMDHFSIWGLKARRLLLAGRLDLGFRELVFTRPDHPLGVPLAWLLLSLGRRPDGAAFKLLHALFALALAAVLYGETRRATRSRALAGAAAAMAAASPLLWDTEAVGLAELPLALFALAAVALLLRAGEEPAPRPWLPGLVLGFLPWVKDEGLVLAGLLLAASPWLAGARGAGAPRGRRSLFLARLAGVAALPAAGALAVQRWLLPQGLSFFNGSWWERGLARAGEVRTVLAFCAGELLAADWLGFWLLLALATAAALALGRRRAAALAGVVWTQVLVYAATGLFTYLDPVQHLRAAFFRIAAALVPLGLLALAAVFAEPERVAIRANPQGDSGVSSE